MFFKRHVIISFVLLLLTACSQQAYVAKPIDVSNAQEKLRAQSTHSANFTQFLLARGYQSNTLPIQQWSLKELTLSAIYHHADMQLAKEKLALATLDAKVAGLKPGISIGGNLAKSNQKNGDIRPWAYGLALNIPIVTNNKQDIAIEKSQYDIEIARLDLARTAWQLRQLLAQDLLTLSEALANIQAYSQIAETQAQLVKQYEKRLKYGVASSIELSKAKLGKQKYDALLAQAKTSISPLLKKIALHAGVPYQDFNLTDLTLSYEDNLLKIINKSLKINQKEMLFNRLDIRQSLLKYAVAESGLKMEIAKQVPDITLSPGVIFEFGDTVWSLGIDTLLSSLKRNDALIARAKQIRSIEAAEVNALQTKRTGELMSAYAQYEQEKARWTLQQSAVAAEKVYYTKLEKQFNAGLIDRLALTQAQLNIDTSLLALNTMKFSYIKTIQALENLLQTPVAEVSIQ